MQRLDDDDGDNLFDDDLNINENDVDFNSLLNDIIVNNNIVLDDDDDNNNNNDDDDDNEIKSKPKPTLANTPNQSPNPIQSNLHIPSPASSQSLHNPA